MYCLSIKIHVKLFKNQCLKIQIIHYYFLALPLISPICIDMLKKRMKNSQKLDEKYFEAKYVTFCLIWKQRQVSQQPPPQSSMGYCKISCRVLKAVSQTTCNAIVTMNKTAVIMKERNTSF